jgi:hypothetical protein
VSSPYPVDEVFEGWVLTLKRKLIHSGLYNPVPSQMNASS